MDNNYQENEQFYTPLQKNAAYYRARAREMLTDRYGAALLVAFLAMILGGISLGNTFSLDLDAETLHRLQSADTQFILRHFLPSILIMAGFGALSTFLFSLFVSSPILLGFQRFQLALCDRDDSRLNAAVLFSYFTSATYWKSVLLNLLQSLILAAISLPVLVAAGAAVLILYASVYMLPIAALILLCGSAITTVIALPVSYSLSYASMIMAEYPETAPMEAIRASRSLMRGNKWRLFCLDFSFFGWILLSVLTLGIGMIFLTPYMQAARAAFYHDVANRESAKDAEFPSLDPDDYAEGAATDKKEDGTDSF